MNHREEGAESTPESFVVCAGAKGIVYSLLTVLVISGLVAAILFGGWDSNLGLESKAAASVFSWTAVVVLSIVCGLGLESWTYRVVVIGSRIESFRFFGLFHEIVSLEELDSAKILTRYPLRWIGRSPPVIELRRASRSIARVPLSHENASRLLSILRDAALIGSDDELE